MSIVQIYASYGVNCCHQLSYRAHSSLDSWNPVDRSSFSLAHTLGKFAKCALGLGPHFYIGTHLCVIV